MQYGCVQTPYSDDYVSLYDDLGAADRWLAALGHKPSLSDRRGLKTVRRSQVLAEKLQLKKNGAGSPVSRNLVYGGELVAIHAYCT